MNSIILPNTVIAKPLRSEPSVRRYLITETEPHTDAALMAYCDCDPYLGGRVERDGGRIVVVRYTS